MTRNITRLFFTGGWDSTFRLLELLLVEEKPVQPIYIIDPSRWSLREEQKAMANIKASVVERFPKTADLLKPTMIIDKTDLKPDPEFKACEQKLLESNIFGSQYEWIGRAAKQFGLEGAEVCAEYSEGKTAGCYVTINPLVEQGKDGSYHFAEEHKNTLEYQFFGMYSFPVMRTSKAEMMEKAEEYGFLDILEMSWFCHKPNIFGQPCGMCNPCKDAMTMEMTHRMPPIGRFCYHLKKNLDPRTHLQHFPKVYDYLRTLKRKLKG